MVTAIYSYCRVKCGCTYLWATHISLLYRKWDYVVQCLAADWSIFHADRTLTKHTSIPIFSTDDLMYFHAKLQMTLTPGGWGRLDSSAMASASASWRRHDRWWLTPYDADDQRVADRDDDGWNDEDSQRYKRDVQLCTQTRRHTYTHVQVLIRLWGSRKPHLANCWTWQLPTTSQHHCPTRILPRNHRPHKFQCFSVLCTIQHWAAIYSKPLFIFIRIHAYTTPTQYPHGLVR